MNKFTQGFSIGHIGLFLALAVTFILQTSPLRAEEGEDAPVKFEHYYVDFTVNPDGTHKRVISVAETILKKEALEEAKEAEITHSTGAEKAEILEAYTRKADGKHIEVPKDNYQIHVDSGKDKNTPAFSDQTTETIIFPEVEVGDTIVYTYAITVTDPIFPNNFMSNLRLTDDIEYDDVKITIDLPATMKIQESELQFARKPDVIKDGRRIIAWTYQNKNPAKHLPDNGYVDNPDQQAGYSISTFFSYGDIAAAYGVRAKPKAAVTPRIQALANDITKDSKTPDDQIKSIYTWVSENITYAGNCIAVGAVVPRDLDFVLNNKMGDCKDHATLTQALLAAKGITSTQALINARDMYHLPKIPTVSAVNHVILYVPSIDKFIDPTSSMPFGMLPHSETGKPVLLVDGYQDGKMTPTSRPDQFQSKVTADVLINADGSADGIVNTKLTGIFGAEAYQAFKKITPDRLKEYTEKTVKAHGFEGTMEYLPGAFDDKTFTYDYGFKFHLKDYIHIGSPGAFYAQAPLTSSLIAYNAAGTKKTEMKKEFPCFGDRSEEIYTYNLPDNLKILATPDNVSFKNKFQDYEAKYEVKDHTLKVTRLHDDVSQGPTCMTDAYAAYLEVANKVIEDMKSQVVYK